MGWNKKGQFVSTALYEIADNVSSKMDHVKKCIKVPDELKFDKLQLQHI